MIAFFCVSDIISRTEYRGRVVNNPASYSRGPYLNLGLEPSFPDWGFSRLNELQIHVDRGDG